VINYPISFFGSSIANAGIQSNWHVTASVFETKCSVPKEFEGSGDSFSPEDFFLLSLQNCFVATFKVYSHYSKLMFEEIKINSELIVDKDEKQKPVMRKIIFKIEVTNPSNQSKAETIINKVLENGFILQSVKTEIITEITYR
jgi:organic hydroperoxide reductase OsmC/OhrA